MGFVIVLWAGIVVLGSGVVVLRVIIAVLLGLRVIPPILVVLGVVRTVKPESGAAFFNAVPVSMAVFA